MNYVVISPVKDEERYVEHTLRSMVDQTCKPVAWIIVDDGSSDRTPELIDQYARRNDFIQVIQRPPGQPRQPGAAVIHAFNRGYETVQSRGLKYDVIVKLDCDLSFDPDYFEKLLAQFVANPKLGIASGVYLEDHGAGWGVVEMPAYHAAGASKVIRRTCWEQIGGFVPSRGWDTVDEIRALTAGWHTTHFRDLQMKHWKAEGTGIGPLKTSAMHGEIYYLTGGGWFFFLLKVLNRIKGRPFFLGAGAMAWGFLSAACSGRQRLVTDDEAKRYRGLLNSRIIGRLKGVPQAS